MCSACCSAKIPKPFPADAPYRTARSAERSGRPSLGITRAPAGRPPGRRKRGRGQRTNRRRKGCVLSKPVAHWTRRVGEQRLAPVRQPALGDLVRGLQRESARLPGRSAPLSTQARTRQLARNSALLRLVMKTTRRLTVEEIQCLSRLLTTRQSRECPKSRRLWLDWPAKGSASEHSSSFP